MWLVAVCVLTAFTLLGCGKKGRPRAHRDTRGSAPAAAIKLEKKAGAVIVRWPQAKQQGQAAVYRLERAEADLRDKDCLTCPHTYSVIADIDDAGPMCRQGDPPECVYTDQQVKTGFRYLYRLKACDTSDRCDAYSQPAKINY